MPGSQEPSAFTRLEPLVTAAEVRRAEEAYEGPMEELMERAGTAVARHVLPPARKAHVLVQHDVAAPLAPARSHCSRGSTMPLPQIWSGATDQPVSERLSSMTRALQPIGFVAAAPPPAA